MAKGLRNARAVRSDKTKKNTSRRGIKLSPARAHALRDTTNAGTTRAAPNLLITIDERHRTRANDEIVALLKEAGFPQAKITQPPGIGLVGVHVKTDDPRECIPKLKGVLMATPFAFQHTHRWLPVDCWAAPDSKALAKFAQRANREIQPQESWSIVVERHGSRLDRAPILDALAQGIQNPHVSLDAPDKVILVEIVGTKAALAVLAADERLSVEKSLRDDFVRFEEVVRFKPG